MVAFKCLSIQLCFRGQKILHKNCKENALTQNFNFTQDTFGIDHIFKGLVYPFDGDLSSCSLRISRCKNVAIGSRADAPGNLVPLIDSNEAILALKLGFSLNFWRENLPDKIFTLPFLIILNLLRLLLFFVNFSFRKSPGRVRLGNSLLLHLPLLGSIHHLIVISLLLTIVLLVLLWHSSLIIIHILIGIGPRRHTLHHRCLLSHHHLVLLRIHHVLRVVLLLILRIHRLLTHQIGLRSTKCCWMVWYLVCRTEVGRGSIRLFFSSWSMHAIGSLHIWLLYLVRYLGLGCTLHSAH